MWQCISLATVQSVFSSTIIILVVSERTVGYSFKVVFLSFLPLMNVCFKFGFRMGSISLNQLAKEKGTNETKENPTYTCMYTCIHVYSYTVHVCMYYICTYTLYSLLVCNSNA